MNSIELINAAIHFEKADRTPVIAQVFGHAATLAGKALGDYVRDGELLANCQIKAFEYYGYDAVFALMDVNVETEAMGSVLTYRKNQYPIVKSYAFSKDTNVDTLKLPNPYEAGRMPELIKAVTILRRKVGDEVLVVGCVLGPLTLTTQLIGIEKTLYLAMDEPQIFSHLLDFSTKIAIIFGVAQIEAGAHLPVVFDPSASPAVVPPKFFREFELPRLEKVFRALKEAGAAANWLHIAGPVENILTFYPEFGVNIANFDYYVNPLDAQRAVPKTCLDGNIKSLSFVVATPQEIAVESSKLLDLFADRNGFILSSGCEIPPESKPENVKALVSAVHARK